MDWPQPAMERGWSEAGRAGLRAWSAAAADLRRHRFGSAQQHAAQASAMLKSTDRLFVAADSSREDITPSNTLLSALAGMNEVVCLFHDLVAARDFKAIMQLPKRLQATLTVLENEKHTMQSLEAQMITLFNLALIQSSVGNMKDTQTAIETILKKAIVLHLMLRQALGTQAENIRTEPKTETKKRRLESDSSTLERIAIDLIDKVFGFGLSKRREQTPYEVKAWNEYEGAREAVQSLGEICIKALQLLVTADLLSSNTEHWKRAKRIMQAIIQRQTLSDTEIETVPSGSTGSTEKANAAHHGVSQLLPNLRCQFGRSTTNDTQLRIDMAYYLLGVAYYLVGKHGKAVRALEKATAKSDGRFFDAHYLLGYLHIIYRNYAQVPILLESIIHEDNPLSLECLNLLAVTHTLMGQPEIGVDTFRRVLQERNCGCSRCSLYNLTVIYGMRDMLEAQDDALSALRSAKSAKLSESPEPAETTPFVTPLESATLAAESQPAIRPLSTIAHAHDVSALTLAYSSARSALTQRDYKRALTQYSSIIKQLDTGTDVPKLETLPVSGSVLWREYIRCIAAVGTLEEVTSACKHLLTTQHSDIDLLFTISDALYQHSQYEEAFAVVDRILSLLNDKSGGRTTFESNSVLGKHKMTSSSTSLTDDQLNELKLRAINNKAMALTRQGKHDDALTQLQAASDLSLKLTDKDHQLDVAFNMAVLLAHMKREEEAASAWLSARGKPLDQPPEFYQQLVSTNATAQLGAKERSYHELDRALGAVWAQKRKQDIINEEIESAHAFALDWDE